MRRVEHYSAMKREEWQMRAHLLNPRLCASERSQSREVTLSVYSILENTRLKRRKTVPWTPGHRGGVCDSSNGVAGANLGGDEPVMYPDHSGGSTNLHIREHAGNCTSGEKLHCTVRNKVRK